MALDRSQAAWGAVQQAARICPTSGEVLGRQGLMAVATGEPAQAIALLTQALNNRPNPPCASAKFLRKQPQEILLALAEFRSTKPKLRQLGICSWMD
jgi:tetratricopeptide (TPR) repeat protein